MLLHGENIKGEEPPCMLHVQHYDPDEEEDIYFARPTWDLDHESIQILPGRALRTHLS